MNLHDWIDEACDVLDVEVDLDEALVLDLARDAAHGVERAAAPVTTYLLGLAAAHHGCSPEELERLAGELSELAKRWDRPDEDEDADEIDDSEEPEEIYADEPEEA